MSEKLTQEYLKECLEYNIETGIFIWKTRPLNHFKNSHGCNIWNSKFSGKVTGSITGSGYILIRINDTAYYAHRLAFLYIEGYVPENEIDHKDGNRSNNIFTNLREASRQCNSQNQKLSKKSMSGITGVSFNKKKNKWIAQIGILRKSKYIGGFKKIEDAARARYEEEQKNPAWSCSVTSSAKQYLISIGEQVEL